VLHVNESEIRNVSFSARTQLFTVVVFPSVDRLFYFDSLLRHPEGGLDYLFVLVNRGNCGKGELRNYAR
jgi:hypothetical protein